MQDAVALGIALVVLFAVGHALNAVSESIYWLWQDRKGDKDV